MSDAELNRRVRLILDESERKQTSDVAMKLVQLQKDVYLQQQLDIAKVYRALGLYQNATQNEFASTRAALRLAVSGK